jgi:hypothetical protein
MRRIGFMLLMIGLTLLMGAGSAQAAGPFGSWLVLPGNTTSGAAGHGYLEVPHSAALNPTGGYTFEAWVKLQTGGGSGCRSIAGKDFTEAWWIGICGDTLRSYLRGSGSAFDSGTVPANNWTHIAVTWDGGTRRHFINGVQTGTTPQALAPTTSTDALRIGSDVSWQYSPSGEIDEVRLWSVARTAAQISGSMNNPITTAQTGLVAVWSLDGTGEDVVGSRDGSLLGSFSFDTFPEPPAGPWLTTASISDFQFKVRITAGGSPITGAKVNDCIEDTLCVSGAVAGRPEVFVRVIGPRPNGYLWPTVIRFTPSQVEVWVQQISSGQINYYQLEAQSPDNEILEGLNDRTGFLP